MGPCLNSDGLTYIGADLSRTRLTDSEQSAVAWAFSSASMIVRNFAIDRLLI